MASIERQRDCLDWRGSARCGSDAPSKGPSTCPMCSGLTINLQLSID
jgi:hypothetical protein